VPGPFAFAFDPVVRLGDSASVRIETVALAIVLFVGLLLAARAASTSPVPLRLDDLAFMVVGAVPGAIFGGRLGYVLDHLSYYSANPSALADPAQGSLTLTLAVPFGILTASVVARLLGAPISRWMHALVPSLLFTLAAGKLIGVLGGSGQGTPVDGPWATAYLGAGPWGSLVADVPSHPSQVYEAIVVAVIVVAMALITRLPSVRRDNGSALFAALGLWALARFSVAFTWRDAAVLGPLRMEQILLIGVALVCLVGLVLRARSRETTPVPPTNEPAADLDGEANPA
jgi:prolipoprotein diacylglyceryltransferase